MDFVVEYLTFDDRVILCVWESSYDKTDLLINVEVMLIQFCLINTLDPNSVQWFSNVRTNFVAIRLLLPLLIDNY